MKFTYGMISLWFFICIFVQGIFGIELILYFEPYFDVIRWIFFYSLSIGMILEFIQPTFIFTDSDGNPFLGVGTFRGLFFIWVILMIIMYYYGYWGFD